MTRSLPLLLHLRSLLSRISPPSRSRWISISTTMTTLTHFDLSGESSDPERAIVTALGLCASGNDVPAGRKIHCRVLKSGLDSNGFICNSVLNMYAKCGLLSDAESVFRSHVRIDSASFNIMVDGYVRSRRLEDARKLFDEMPDRGCVSYTTMIKGYTQSERWREAMELFGEMRNAGIAPNEATLATVISACSHLGGISDCKMLHCLTMKLQLDDRVFVSTNLLRMYCVCSSLDDGRRLFDEMPGRNLVTWNVMLNGYSKAGLIELARDLFDQITEKDIVSWGTMIDGYLRKERLNEALALYREMLSHGMNPSDFMMVDFLSASARAEGIYEGLQLHCAVVKAGFDCHAFIQATIIHFYGARGDINLALQQFEASFKDNVASRNALIAGFAKNGMIQNAREVFDHTHDKDIFSWNAMISGYAQSVTPGLALQLFHQMRDGSVKPDAITMVSVFYAASVLGDLEEGKRAHEYIHCSSIPLSDNLTAAMVDMYAKCGSIDNALTVFYQTRDKTSTISPWNAIICGLATHGRASRAIDLYSDLQTRPIRPNAITFVGVLSACCHSGLLELGKRHFESMKRVYGIEPDVKHYNCMVDLMGRAGKLKEAEEMIGEMAVKADEVIWGTLLAAARIHGNVNVAERAAAELEAVDPSHGGCRVLLSNVYANAGRWEDVASVRRGILSVQRLSAFSGVL